jgi:PiT family inorganic phosphate transporter
VVVIVLIVVFALAFSLSNGWNDSANAIATVVSTRVLSPWQAIVFGSILNLVGALFSDQVANTIGKDIADPKLLSPATFLAAVVVAPIWVTWCTLRGLPISCSHSLMGGLVGAVVASVGFGGLKGAGITKILIGVFTSPILGFILGYLIILAVAWTFRRVRPATASAVFGKLQLVSAAAMAFAHGTGDAQKAMGLISGALVSGGFLSMVVRPDGKEMLPIPLWVRLACAATMAVGTALGGWAVMRTLGQRLAHLKPHQGFAAETAASFTILINTLWRGIPISTTHSITGAIMGVGAAHGIRTVKWGVGKKIIFAWVFTFPVCIVGGVVICWLLRAVGLG